MLRVVSQRLKLLCMLACIMVPLFNNLAWGAHPLAGLLSQVSAARRPVTSDLTCFLSASALSFRSFSSANCRAAASSAAFLAASLRARCCAASCFRRSASNSCCLLSFACTHAYHVTSLHTGRGSNLGVLLGSTVYESRSILCCCCISPHRERLLVHPP